MLTISCKVIWEGTSRHPFKMQSTLAVIDSPAPVAKAALPPLGTPAGLDCHPEV